MIVKFENCLRKSIVLIIKVLEVDCVKNHKPLSFFEKPCQFTSPKTSTFSGSEHVCGIIKSYFCFEAVPLVYCNVRYFYFAVTNVTHKTLLSFANELLFHNRGKLCLL